MKLFIYFINLFLLLVVNVNAEPTCEDHFGVSFCNECQKEVWDFKKEPLGCGFYSNLFAEIEHGPFLSNYDLTTYNKVIKNACSADFSCSYEEGRKTWQRVEEKCANELTTYIDWRANPSSIDHTVVSAYATILVYYFAVPQHNSVCHKTSSGGMYDLIIFFF
jgi:hypothetical protein